MSSHLLYCGDPVRPRRVDAHFADEARRARDLGAVVVRVDHDAVLRGDLDAAVAAVPRDIGPVWYRGWMTSADGYAALGERLAERGVVLRTTPAAYRRAHELPGWYDAFSPFTPAAAWSAGVPDDAELAALARRLPPGPGMVKDYVKSAKSTPGAFRIDDLTDPANVRAVVGEFVRLRDGAPEGGIVLRAFEDFAGSGEIRVWWCDGEPVYVGPHPDDPDTPVDGDLDPSFLADAVAAHGCRFVTTDLARRADGAWRMIELGDGQVSDFPAGADVEPLLRALIAA